MQQDNGDTSSSNMESTSIVFMTDTNFSSDSPSPPKKLSVGNDDEQENDINNAWTMKLTDTSKTMSLNEVAENASLFNMMMITPQEEDAAAAENIIASEDCKETVISLARAFLLGTDSEWITIATGLAVTQLVDDENSNIGDDQTGKALRISLLEDAQDSAHHAMTKDGNRMNANNALNFLNNDSTRRALFSTSIVAHQQVTRQQATVVTWTLNDGADIALSFEHERGCDQFWSAVCQFLGISPEYSLEEEEEEEGEEDVEHQAQSRMGYEEKEDGHSTSMDCDYETAGSLRHASSNQRSARTRNSMAMETMPSSESSSYYPIATSDQVTLLPDQVNIHTLEVIEELLKHTMSMTPDSYALHSRKRLLIPEIMSDGLVSRLLDLFLDIEEQVPSVGVDAAIKVMPLMVSIFRNLFLLNSPVLLRELLQTEHIIHLAGVFEYDSQLTSFNVDSRNEKEKDDTDDYESMNRMHYRDQMARSDRFKQIVAIDNGDLLQIIHQTFRIQFLKDVVLCTQLDEDTLSSISLLIRCNYADIVSMIEGSEEEQTEGNGFLHQLKSVLEMPEQQQDAGCIRDIVGFLKEYVTISKGTSSHTSSRLLEPFMLVPLLRFLAQALSMHPNDQHNVDDWHVVKMAADVFGHLIQADAAVVRSAMLSKAACTGMPNAAFDGDLMRLVIDLVVNTSTPCGIRWMLVSLVRLLLDCGSTPTVSSCSTIESNHQVASDTREYGESLLVPSGANGSAIAGLNLSVDEFLNAIYPDIALQLLSPLNPSSLHFRTTFLNPSTVSISRGAIDMYMQLCDLLSSFIVHHKYRIKYLLFRSSIVHGVCRLLSYSTGNTSCPLVLRMCALRVLRAMIGTGDEFYFRFLIKQSLLVNAVHAMVDVGASGSAFDSALIEFFSHLMDQKLSLLIEHLLDMHGSVLLKVQSIPLHQLLHDVYRNMSSFTTTSDLSTGQPVPMRSALVTAPSDSDEEEAVLSDGNSRIVANEKNDQNRKMQKENGENLESADMAKPSAYYWNMYRSVLLAAEEEKSSQVSGKSFANSK